MKTPLPLAIILLIATPGFAQAPAGPPKNLFTNGGFESVTSRANLWDGVDSDGYLAGINVLDPDNPAGGGAGVPALALSGQVVETILPPSVSCVDINGDGLLDLIVAWPSGYLCAYINSGTNTEPKFTNGEILPIFLARMKNYSDFFRKAPRINFFAWTRGGLPDLVMGNYQGEIMFIPNTGMRTSPDFRQPKTIDSVVLPTAKNLWGNLFAPVACDFSNTGKPDLLVGEGSYSANAIHLLINKGTSMTPKFSEDARFYLAYGDGREHLVPTLADYNGDGYMDLLVADREGKVGVYLNPGASWKPGSEFKFSSYVTFGGKEELGSAVAPCAADLNGDGLFDLVFGKTSGRIALAINRGTKDQPKFDVPVEIKGINTDPSRFNIPSGWSMSCGFYRNANTYAYFSCVSAQEDKEADPQEGQRVLKMAYLDCPNKVFKKPELHFPADPNPSYLEFGAETGTFFLSQGFSDQGGLKTGNEYELSFKVKGNEVKDALWTLVCIGYKTNKPDQIQRGARGIAKITQDITKEQITETGNINAGTSWSTVTRKITVRFKAPQLKEPDSILAIFQIRGYLTPGKGVLYLDDIKLVRKN